MPALIVPHNPSMDVNQTPLQLRLEGETATGWSSSNPRAVTIDERGLCRAVGGGVATISATYLYEGETRVATTNVHSGDLLIYGADGTLYQVPPSVWTANPISPALEPGIPSAEFMTINELQGVYINPPDKPASEASVVYVCYVLDLAAIPIPPPAKK
jgi:hypothetical protein